MNRNTTRKALIGLLTLSLATGFIHPGKANAATAKINKSSLTLTKGSQYNLKVKGTSEKITWKTSNKKVAIVNQSGKVTAVKTGKAKITAKVKSKKLICQIIVKKKKPATTQKPVITQAPITTQTPIRTQTPAATLAPAKTPAPVSTQMPVTTQKPVSTTTPSVSEVTEESAYNILNALRSTYPEGMPLTNSYYYYSPQFGNGYGCYGFAAKLSDTVFGTQTPYKTHTSFDKIRVGDNIRIGNSHSVIVLTKSDNAITVVEGNYNASVHWDRKITAASLASSRFTVYTRY